MSDKDFQSKRDKKISTTGRGEGITKAATWITNVGIGMDIIMILE